MVNSIFSLFFLLLVFLTTGLVFIESISYQGFTEKFVPVSVQLLVLLDLFIAFLNIIRKKPDQLPKVIANVNQYIILPASLITTLILTILELFTYPNFIFNNFHIHYELIFLLFLISLSVGIFSFNKNKLKNINIFILLISLLLLLIFGIISTWPGGVFNDIIREDNLIENLQVIFYGFSCFIFFLLTYRNLHTSKLNTIYFLGFALALLFISGEEISWGQRLLSLNSPELMIQNNAQGEITVHNVNGLQELQPIIYMLFAAYLSSAWIFISAIPKKFKIKFQPLIPNQYFMFYFLPILFFYIHINVFGGKHWQWQEPCELLLAIGLFIFSSLKIKEYSKN